MGYTGRAGSFPGQAGAPALTQPSLGQGPIWGRVTRVIGGVMAQVSGKGLFLATAPLGVQDVYPGQRGVRLLLRLERLCPPPRPSRGPAPVAPSSPGSAPSANAPAPWELAEGNVCHCQEPPRRAGSRLHGPESQGEQGRRLQAWPWHRVELTSGGGMTQKGEILDSMPWLPG